MVSIAGRGAALCGGGFFFKAASIFRPLSTVAFRCSSSLQPPDVPRLADAARITLSPKEIEDFAPKIGQVINWFGQLQSVNLDSVEPSLRADTEVCATQRDDLPEMFENREAILAAAPSYSDPYIKVPKVLNKE